MFRKFVFLMFNAVAFGLISQVNLTSNLKICMPFNGNASDLSGNGNNGTVNGATLTADRFGTPNSAYAFGPNMFISVPSLSVVQTNNEMTISMWGKTYNNTSNCLFVLAPDNASDRCVGCAAYSNSGNTMMLFDYGSIYSGGRTVTTGIPVDHTNWHHYVYVLSQSGNLKLMYRDGILINNSTYALTCNSKNLQFQIGGGYDQSMGSLYFYGYIDDVYIYNRALNASEISALYAGSNVCGNAQTGIEQLKDIEEAIVYPTVSQTGIYNFSIKEISDSRIEIYTVDGKLIRSYNQLTALNNTIDMSQAESGVYIVKLITPGKILTRKLVKN